MGDKAVPKLIDWIGGPSRVEELIERFYDAVLEDSLLEPLFRGMDSQHFRYVAMFISEVFSGPEAYSAERGGHRNMIRRHIGKGITEEQRQRWVGLLLQNADKVGIPDDPEFRSALVAYLEWGSRLAVINSELGADVRGGSTDAEVGLGRGRWALHRGLAGSIV